MYSIIILKIFLEKFGSPQNKLHSQTLGAAHWLRNTGLDHHSKLAVLDVIKNCHYSQGCFHFESLGDMFYPPPLLPPVVLRTLNS